VYGKYLRPLFSKTDEIVEYNGVRVRPYCSLDKFVPVTLPPNKGGHRNPDHYEHGLVEGLRTTVSSGDSVVIVGGGLGVTAVIAGRQAGPEGDVTVYEGAENMVEHIEETIEINNPPCPIRVEHGIVGAAHRLDGLSGDAAIVPSENLPECDVLEMDCEGAEEEILSDLAIRPKHIIVETHGNETQIRNELTTIGYEITSGVVAEREPYLSMCKYNGINVLTALKR
jgi:hypothetical protein